MPLLRGSSHDRIHTGSANATGPNRHGSGPARAYGRLFAGTVIHAVGPNFRAMEELDHPLDSHGSDALLTSAYASSMQLAAGRHVRYLGFSLLSAGSFRGSRSLDDVLQARAAPSPTPFG
jgi:O-acetyl-ADP-ribose deacetylase (regulator of RNase III)